MKTIAVGCGQYVGILIIPCIISFLFLLWWSDLAAAESIDRFFLMGDRNIHIKNTKTGKEAAVRLLDSNGFPDEEALKRIDEVFEFPTAEKGEHIALRLLFMLDYFSDLAAPGKIILLDSGYRNPEYNADLRNSGGNVARTSTHLDGMAIDFHIEGVNGKYLWNVIKDKECCGIGHYGGMSVHLDCSRPRFWEAATSKVTSGESDYNRRIYVTTEYDRYRKGETIRLSFCSVSDFGFGVEPKATLVKSSEADSKTIASADLRFKTPVEDKNCLMIQDRQSSHFLYLEMPVNIPPGRYKIKMQFCNRPFEQMPTSILSNEIELTD